MFLPHFLLKGSLLLGSFSGFRPTRFFNGNFDRSLPRVVVPLIPCSSLSSPRGITVFLNLPYGVSFRVTANKGICANQALNVNCTTKQPFEVNDWVCLVHSVKLRFFVTSAGSLHCEKKTVACSRRPVRKTERNGKRRDSSGRSEKGRGILCRVAVLIKNCK